MQVPYTIPNHLLSPGISNAKTKKNLRPTRILYLSSANDNELGVNLCGYSSKGCRESCLVTAGMGAFDNVAKARRNKTHYYLQDRFSFLEQVAKEISRAAYTQSKKGLELAIRLNGTSDIKLVEMVTKAYGYMIGKNVVFYDYTKYPKKAGDYTLPSGHRYMVTLSRSEDNEDDCLRHLKDGGIVAVVFRKELPTHWHGYPVVDGDERDDLMLDLPKGTIIGLLAKGKAKYNTNNFVLN